MAIPRQHVQQPVLTAPVQRCPTPFRAAFSAASQHTVRLQPVSRQQQQQRRALRSSCRRHRICTVHAEAAPDATKYEDADYDKLADEIRVSLGLRRWAA
jgi:hypothetical protein